MALGKYLSSEKSGPVIIKRNKEARSDLFPSSVTVEKNNSNQIAFILSHYCQFSFKVKTSNNPVSVLK